MSVAPEGKVQQNTTQKPHFLLEGRYTTGISEQMKEIQYISLVHAVLAELELVSTVKLNTTAAIS